MPLLAWFVPAYVYIRPGNTSSSVSLFSFTFAAGPLGSNISCCNLKNSRYIGYIILLAALIVIYRTFFGIVMGIYCWGHRPISIKWLFGWWGDGFIFWHAPNIYSLLGIPFIHNNGKGTKRKLLNAHIYWLDGSAVWSTGDGGVSLLYWMVIASYDQENILLE